MTRNADAPSPDARITGGCPPSHESGVSPDEILSAAADAIIVSDDDGRILAFNPAAERLFGVPAKQALQGRVEHLLSPVPAGRTFTGPASPLPAIGRRADGTEFPVAVSFSMTDGPNPRHGLLIVRERSDQVASDRRIERLNDQLRSLSLRLQTIREEERTALAREIHDQLSQDLTRIKIDIVWCHQTMLQLGNEGAPRKITDRLESVVAEVHDAITAVQRLASRLRPTLLDHFGLEAAIEWECREFSKRTGISSSATLPPQKIASSPEQATAIFRILQESLTNIIRHAGATDVLVTLNGSEEDIFLQIADNGRGIPREKLLDARSLGILGIRERAQGLDGTAEFTSEPGAGTVVTVRLPRLPRGPIQPIHEDPDC